MQNDHGSTVEPKTGFQILGRCANRYAQYLILLVIIAKCHTIFLAKKPKLIYQINMTILINGVK